MSSKDWASTSRSRGIGGVWRVLPLALVGVVFALFASAASANLNPPTVFIVDQGEPPAEVPPHVKYTKTIQEAVNASKPRDWILIEPGVYDEEVRVTYTHHNIWIRGMNRNTVIVDGQNKPKPEGSNGIEVYKTNDVWIQNLTVRNFDRASLNGPNGNEIWWNGGENSKRINAHGWYGSYLTAYDTGLDGGYGIFTDNEKSGEWNNIYASGFNDSGMYLGACQECKAKIIGAVMEDNALGYSGSNSGGELVIENSTFKHNTDGIAPNSENPGDGPPPQDGQCNHVHETLPAPFTSTEIERCTIFRNNLITENNNLNVPANNSAAAAPWGAGIELPGTYADLVEGNTITKQPTDGILAFEYPNPFPPTKKTLYFQLAGNKIANNKFAENGTAGGEFAGDLMMAGGLFGTKTSTQNCVSGNTFTDATYPANIEETWGCQNKTTPNPELGIAGVQYLLALQEVSQKRTAEPQVAPPAQPTMPNPCEGVPQKTPNCP